MYLLNPGDEVFSPMNVWPESSLKQQRLSRTNEWVQIRIEKKARLLNQKEDCNTSPTYVYGGSHLKILRIHLLI